MQSTSSSASSEVASKKYTRVLGKQQQDEESARVLSATDALPPPSVELAHKTPFAVRNLKAYANRNSRFLAENRDSGDVCHLYAVGWAAGIVVRVSDWQSSSSTGNSGSGGAGTEAGGASTSTAAGSSASSKRKLPARSMAEVLFVSDDPLVKVAASCTVAPVVPVEISSEYDAILVDPYPRLPEERDRRNAMGLLSREAYLRMRGLSHRVYILKVPVPKDAAEACAKFTSIASDGAAPGGDDHRYVTWTAGTCATIYVDKGTVCEGRLYRFTNLSAYLAPKSGNVSFSATATLFNPRLAPTQLCHHELAPLVAPGLGLFWELPLRPWSTHVISLPIMCPSKFVQYVYPDMFANTVASALVGHCSMAPVQVAYKRITVANVQPWQEKTINQTQYSSYMTFWDGYVSPNPLGLRYLAATAEQHCSPSPEVQQMLREEPLGIRVSLEIPKDVLRGALGIWNDVRLRAYAANMLAHAPVVITARASKDNCDSKQACSIAALLGNAPTASAAAASKSPQQQPQHEDDGEDGVPPASPPPPSVGSSSSGSVSDEAIKNALSFCPVQLRATGLSIDLPSTLGMCALQVTHAQAQSLWTLAKQRAPPETFEETHNLFATTDTIVPLFETPRSMILTLDKDDKDGYVYFVQFAYTNDLNDGRSIVDNFRTLVERYSYVQQASTAAAAAATATASTSASQQQQDDQEDILPACNRAFLRKRAQGVLDQYWKRVPQEEDIRRFVQGLIDKPTGDREVWRIMLLWGVQQTLYQHIIDGEAEVSTLGEATLRCVRMFA